MSFVLEEDPASIFWPVKFDVGQSGGTYRRMTFEAEFRVIGNEELQELFNPDGEVTKSDYECSYWLERYPGQRRRGGSFHD